MDPLTISVAAFGVSALLARKAKIDKGNKQPVDSQGNPIKPVESGTPYDTEADPNVSLGATISTEVGKGKFTFKVVGSGLMAGISAGIAGGPLGAVIGGGIGAGIGAITAVIMRLRDPVDYQAWDWDSWGMPNRPDLTRYLDGRIILTIPSADLFTPQEIAFSQAWIVANLCGGSESVFQSWKRGGVFGWYPRGLPTPFSKLLDECAPWLADWNANFLKSFMQKSATVEGETFNIGWANFPDTILSEKGVGERIQIIRRAHYYQARGFGLQAWHTIGNFRDKLWSKLDVLDFKADNEDVKEVYEILAERMGKILMADIGYPGAFFLVNPETKLSNRAGFQTTSISERLGDLSGDRLANAGIRRQSLDAKSIKISTNVSLRNSAPTDLPIKFGLWCRDGVYSVGPVICSTEWFADLFGSNAMVVQELVQGSLTYDPKSTDKVSERFRALFPGLREAEKHPRIMQRYAPLDFPKVSLEFYRKSEGGGLMRIDKKTGKLTPINEDGKLALALEEDNVLDWYKV